MDTYKTLLPPDFLVCYRDVLPGLRRFDQNGQLCTKTNATISTLASPMLAPMCSITLKGVQLVVPQPLHNLITAMPQIAGQALP